MRQERTAGRTERGTESPQGMLAAARRILGRIRGEKRPWRARDTLLGLFAGAVTVLFLGHGLVPNPLGIGTLLDSVIPWLGVLPVLALVPALLGRCRATGLLLVPVLVWALVFGRSLPADGASGEGHLEVVTQNLYADNREPEVTLRQLARTGSDLVGLQEVTNGDREEVTEILGSEYPHHASVGTVGLWSRYPLSEVRTVDLGLGWGRALRATVRTPEGVTAVYTVHLPSLRPDLVERRDRALERLAEAVRGERIRRVVLLGDLNTAGTDRALDTLTGVLPARAASATNGFGFTWPAGFPVVRLDHVLARAMRPVTSEVLDTSGSDHRAVRTTLTY